MPLEPNCEKEIKNLQVRIAEEVVPKYFKVIHLKQYALLSAIDRD